MARPPRASYQKEISKAARALERDRARRRELAKTLDELDALIRDRARVLRALIDDATAGVPDAPPLSIDEQP